jgi:hypothetical protein
MNKRKHVAAEPARIRHKNAQNRLRGDRRVRSRTAGQQHFLPRCDSKRVSGRHSTEVPAYHRAHCRRERIRYERHAQTAVYPPSMTMDVPAM